MEGASRTDEVVVHRARTLLGFMSEEEAMAFTSMWAVAGWDEIGPRWQEAREAVETTPSSAPTRPRLEPLPGEASEHVEAIKASADFKAVFGDKEGIFAFVQVDPLVTLQRYVDTDFARQAVQGITPASSLDSKLACLLPRRDAAQCYVSYDRAPILSATVTSLSRNLDVSELRVRHEPGEPIRVTFDVRQPPGWVQVVEYEGRHYLRDGYHRAWGMRALGEELVPAIVWTARSVQDIAGRRGVPTDVIDADRPPLFRHFFDEMVAPDLAVRSALTVVRITAEKFTVPRVP